MLDRVLVALSSPQNSTALPVFAIDVRAHFANSLTVDELPPYRREISAGFLVSINLSSSPFAILVGLGLYYRRRAATLALLPPALGRMRILNAVGPQAF